MEKIRVVWICHFSNQKIRERLPLSKRYFSTALRRILGKQEVKYNDFAPWVTSQIKEFEKFMNVELHIITPHYGLTRLTSEFEMNGVFYHFFKPDDKSILDKVYKKFFNKSDPKYLRNRKLVKRFIKEIQPDIANLIGSENPYYSITTLDIENIPVYVSAQTVYTNPDRKKYSGMVNNYRWDIELKIHQKEKYYGCGGRMHRDLILNNNPDAFIFKSFFPIQKLSTFEKKISKTFDFVFFAAQVTNKKGIEDAINALAIVKRSHPHVTLNVVGSCTISYKNLLLVKISDLGLDDNIIFDGYFPVHSDMHHHVTKSRFAVLPIKLDVISGTIIEAILLDLPVVTYKTTGTPYLNKSGQAVLISDLQNVENLAANMMKLLENPKLGEKLKINARAFVEKEFDNTTSAIRLVYNYSAVIDHYYQNKPIPKKLLFDINEFPLY